MENMVQDLLMRPAFFNSSVITLSAQPSTIFSVYGSRGIEGFASSLITDISTHAKRAGVPYRLTIMPGVDQDPPSHQQRILQKAHGQRKILSVLKVRPLNRNRAVIGNGHSGKEESDLREPGKVPNLGAQRKRPPCLDEPMCIEH
ncbi:hypothetical protein B0H10DRAFT_1959872 [Mycena sp. CBHHK59/15]|nr:hypothetical protein B0H10DRAFT_1959872 [Mycena sp. CBHHK59/15]